MREKFHKVVKQYGWYLGFVYCFFMSPWCFANSAVDPLQGSLADVTATFGPNSTIAHYMYGLEVVLCVAQYMRSKNPLLIASALVVPLAHHTLWNAYVS